VAEPGRLFLDLIIQTQVVTGNQQNANHYFFFFNYSIFFFFFVFRICFGHWLQCFDFVKTIVFSPWQGCQMYFHSIKKSITT
jgi:hypothetical protein